MNEGQLLPSVITYSHEHKIAPFENGTDQRYVNSSVQKYSVSAELQICLYLTLPLELDTLHDMKWDLFIMSSYGKNPPLPIPKPILISFLEERGGGILTRPGAMRQGRWVWAVMGISHP